MAFHTIPLESNFMSTLRFIRKDPFMTLETDLIGIGIEQLPMPRGMRVMALGAFPALDGGVNELALQFFFEIGMAVQAEFAPGVRFQLEFTVLCVTN